MAIDLEPIADIGAALGSAHPELEAVRAAAAFLRGHPECFVGGPRADNPAHVALAAVMVYDVFLTPDAPLPESLLCELVQARMAEAHG